MTCMREFRMVLCRQSRVSIMRLHALHSIRNKSVTVLPAGSTWVNLGHTHSSLCPG